VDLLGLLSNKCMAAYQYAVLTIKYQLKIETPDLISESLDPNGEFLTLDYSRFAWATKAPNQNDNQVLRENEAPGMPQRTLDYALTFYRVQSLPTWIRNYINTVNDSPVTTKLLGMTFDAETLLFNPPKATRKWKFAKFPYWQVDLKMSCRPKNKNGRGGWNQVWRTGLQTDDGRGNQTFGGYDSLLINTGNIIENPGSAGAKIVKPKYKPFPMFEKTDFSKIWTLGAGSKGVKMPNQGQPPGGK
jgi:hypothetical protein